MPIYCKAYKLEDLRKYDKWADRAKETEKELEDDAIVYIHEKLFVTKNCLELDKEEDHIFTEVDAEWEAFCKNELEFQVPDWEEESRKVREALAKEEAAKAETEAEAG